MTLYDYFRSTACYRVRLALSIKQLEYTKIEVHLVNQGGAQNTPEYQVINPQKLVPSLEVEGQIITQSLAIIHYLEAKYPTPPLLPKDSFAKATVESLALMVACDMHPLNNLRALKRLKEQFAADESQVTAWYHHWLKEGFDAFEARLKTMKRSLPVCYGDSVTLADLCLIPQVYNAHRFHFSMQAYPLISEINGYCTALEAFKKAAPN